MFNRYHKHNTSKIEHQIFLQNLLHPEPSPSYLTATPSFQLLRQNPIGVIFNFFLSHLTWNLSGNATGSNFKIHQKSVHLLVQTIISGLDYYNSILTGLPVSALASLPSSQSDPVKTYIRGFPGGAVVKNQPASQWLRIRLPMQGTWVRTLVWEDPTCCGAIEPMRHNY